MSSAPSKKKDNVREKRSKNSSSSSNSTKTKTKSKTKPTKRAKTAEEKKLLPRGYDLHLFEKTRRAKKYRCKICGKIPRKPYEGRYCGCRFCKECILEHLGLLFHKSAK